MSTAFASVIIAFAVELTAAEPDRLLLGNWGIALWVG